MESPITHPWIWSDEVAESFYNRIVTGFRAGAYNGGLIYLQPGKQPPEGGQHLMIKMVYWRAQRDLSVEATITADFDAGDGVTRTLGIVGGRSMLHYNPFPDRMVLERAFDESAEDAGRQLLQRLTRNQ